MTDERQESEERAEEQEQDEGSAQEEGAEAEGGEGESAEGESDASGDGDVSEDEDPKAVVKKLEEEGLPEDLEDWPQGKAKYETFGGPEGEHGYHEGPEQQLGPSSLRHHEEGDVSIAGEEVDDPDEYKGKPIPGGPTDPDAPTAQGEDSDPSEESEDSGESSDEGSEESDEGSDDSEEDSG